MITENYTKMCEQAEEIQKEWKKKKTHIMDNVYTKHTEENILILEEIEFSNDKDEGGEDREYIIFKRAGITVEPIPFTTFNKETFYQYDDGELNVVYLPTQEQLQEMIGVYDVLISTKVINNMLMLKNQFRSVQELLLAYVMKFKYHKFWTGEKWVKAND